jgi:hypothetical protein
MEGLLPPELVKPVLIAGVALFVMSVVDTLAYGVRTAGVLTRRLAISLSLFNILVTFSRLSNMIQAPFLGRMSDDVNAGLYESADVLVGLRIDLLLIIAGVLFGAQLMPTFIKLAERGIEILEKKGNLASTALYGLSRFWRLPDYWSFPVGQVRELTRLGNIPYNFLVWNVFVTCFYSIGVMSTVLAASWNHELAGTCILLSGIVNGIATMLLFIVVDPPSAIVVDQCINGKRPVRDAKVLNLYLVLTRLLGTALAVLMLPLMARYVLTVAHWVKGV